jgi:pyrroloquinoline quinone (PQQ) biosynthesis protein C
VQSPLPDCEAICRFDDMSIRGSFSEEAQTSIAGGKTIMSDARELIDTIRNELKPLHQKIIGHRYLAALETGQVARESLSVFAVQQHHIIASDLRSIALLIARHGDLPSRPYLLNILQGENSAFEALTKFAQALGISNATLGGSEPIPAAFAYSAFLAWLGMYGSDAEMASALSLNFVAWGANCGRMSAALKAGYGLTAEAVTFFDLFANLPPASDAAIPVIQAGLDRGVSTALIARAARMLQGYELMYWDSMAEAASVS